MSQSEVVPIQKPATQCAPFITGECEKALHVEFGRNTSTKGYTKMYQTISSVKRIAPLVKTEAALLFQFVLFELRYSLNTVEKITEAQLAGTRGGPNGKVGCFLWKYLIGKYLQGHMEEATVNGGPNFAHEMNELKSKFSTYGTSDVYWKRPLFRGSPQGDTDDGDSMSRYDAWKKTMRRFTGGI